MTAAMAPLERRTFHFVRDGKETAATFTIERLHPRVFLDLLKLWPPVADLQRIRAGESAPEKSRRAVTNIQDRAIKHALIHLADESGRSVPLDQLRSMGEGFAGQVFVKIWRSNLDYHRAKGVA